MTSLRLYDNTRLNDAKRCMRYYYFRHIKHWTPNGGPSAALAFGTGWHEAMDTLWQLIADDEKRDYVVGKAFEAFKKAWLAAGMPEEDTMDDLDRKFWLPRVPNTAYEMLWGYYDQRHRFIKDCELLEVERPFAVPLTPDDPTLFYVGRIDKIVRPGENKKSIRGLDHKTTTATKLIGKKTKIRPLFLESFSPDSQMDGYLFALGMIYETYCDLYVDCALVHATEHDAFSFVPVDRMPEMLDGWLGTTHWWINTIESELETLGMSSKHDRYLSAFPQNTRSCFDFNTACPFLPLCKSRSNPESWEEVPPGFKIEKWDPLQHAGTPKELM